jgi:ribonuclease HI
MNTYTLYFDGCSKSNPGPSGAGYVIYETNLETNQTKELESAALYVGAKATNNVAEYSGLLFGLQKAADLQIKTLTVKGDSLLVIKQMRGEYQVKSPNLLDLHKKCKQLVPQFEQIEFIHVLRHLNTRADALSNLGVENKAT